MWIEELNKQYRIILASGSPRRQSLLKEIGIKYEIITSKDVEETYPAGLEKHEIPMFLAEKKASAVSSLLQEKTIIIGADTIVWLNNKVINKPTDYNDAVTILRSLSGNMHEVLTGVCLLAATERRTFYSLSRVYFNPLTESEIKFYIEQYKPYDKAGAYGIQEWIGYVAIEKIEGSFYNVMGLPIEMVYRELKQLSCL